MTFTEKYPSLKEQEVDRPEGVNVPYEPICLNISEQILKDKGGISLTLNEVAPTINHIWKHSNRGGFVRTYLTKEGKEFKERLAAKVPKGFKPIEGTCRVELDLTFPTKRKNDIDNYCKAILDALNRKVYVDDSQIIELLIRKHYEKNQPKIKIKIEPY